MLLKYGEEDTPLFFSFPSLRATQSKKMNTISDPSTLTTNIIIHKKGNRGHICVMRKITTILFWSLILSDISFAMRLVVQKVKSASVTVEGRVISSIGPGAMALVGLHENDSKEDLEYCCKRLLACKLWENDNGALWRHGVKQRELELLCVSQFTLYGTLTKKNQPDYKLAMKAIPAKELYNEFLDMLKSNYAEEKIKDGEFGAMMDVSLVNDGPVTIIIESSPKTPEPSDSIKDEP